MAPRLTRRELLGGAGVAAAPFVAGRSDAGDAPTGTGGDDTATATPDPDLRIDERYLSSAFPIEFVAPGFEERTGVAGDARIAYVHWHGADVSHWQQSPLELAAGEAAPVRTAVDGARVDVLAEAAGEAELLFELRAGGDSEWVSPPLPVEIVRAPSRAVRTRRPFDPASDAGRL